MCLHSPPLTVTCRETATCACSWWSTDDPNQYTAEHSGAVKVYIMRCFTQMCRARHAGVSIRNVKTTRIASIPVCIYLRYIRKRLLLALICSLYAGWATILRWTLLSSIHSALGSKCRWYKCWWSCWATMLTTKSWGKPASLWCNKWKSSSLWCGKIR